MKKLWCYYWAWLGLSLGPNIRADPLQNKVITDYYTAFLNITYFDGDRGVFHTERTETGRFSTNVPKDFSGQVVILANQKDTNESEAIYTGTIFRYIRDFRNFQVRHFVLWELTIHKKFYWMIFFTKRNVFWWFYRYFPHRIQRYDRWIPALFWHRFLLMWCLMPLINVWLVDDELELILKWNEN